jgi:hypothetical protein
MERNEFRVVPVTRYIVTRYFWDESGKKQGFSQEVGEFPSLGAATFVAGALHASTPGSVFEPYEEPPVPVWTVKAWTEEEAEALHAKIHGPDAILICGPKTADKAQKRMAKG